MKIQWNKVTWYSKLIAVVLFFLLPATGFYLGFQYQRSVSPTKSTETSVVQNNRTDKNVISDNRNRSCGKSTIIVFKLNVSLQEADKYFAKYDMKLEDALTGGYLLEVGPGGDTHWINRIKADGIGEAAYDTIGCDFFDD
jgi:hypothetical protein